MKQMKYKKQIQLIAAIVTLIVFPVITFYLMEAYTHNPFEEVRPWAQFFNILLFELLAWIFVSVTGKIQSGLRIELVIAMIYGIANAYVVRFRTNPIVPWDIFSWKTAASVASNYDFKPDTRMVVVTLVFLGMIVLLQFVKTGIPKFQLWKRLIPAGVCCIVLVLFVNLLQDEDFQTGHRLYPFLFTPAFMTQVNGMAVTFAMDLAYVTVEKPSGYDAAKEQAVLESYTEQEDDADSSDKKEKQPNIIVVMNESFSDLKVLGDFTTNEDYMPFIHSLKKNTIKGSLYMSIFGSGTCNSEFEYLTGNSMSFLQNGIIAYTQVVKDKLPNMTYLLKEQGYKGNLALHPYLASGWNRVQVYDYMGFDHFYSETDFKNPTMYRKYISDESDFKKIEELYENRTEKDEPFYLFNVTMQNHGGFDKTYSNFHNDIQITDNHKNEQAEQYLSLVKKTDDAFKQLVEYFSKVKEPTIIVMYGDHQPAVQSSFYDSLFGKSAGSLTNEELMNKYRTPFIIWANYDIKEKTIDKMSANYLSAYVMNEAGLETSPYQKFLLKLRKKLPVLTAMGCFDKKGKYYESALESPYSDMVKEYQILQYNNLIDTKHTVNSFFYLSDEQKK